jgi:hypothetical protein
MKCKLKLYRYVVNRNVSKSNLKLNIVNLKLIISIFLKRRPHYLIKKDTADTLCPDTCSKKKKTFVVVEK